MAPRVGAHMSIAGGVDLAVDRAVACGCAALQVFTKSSNQWKARPLAADEVARFRDKARAAHLLPLLAHTSYLINVGSPDAALWRKSVDALTDEVVRAGALGIAYVVLHPGAHVGSGASEACARVAAALDEVLAAAGTAGVKILLENTAGQGTTLGRTFEELASIIDKTRHKARLGVCFDTCHAFAAGYDIASRDGWRKTWDEFDRILGSGRLHALHLNDSKKGLGSRVDRHEHIGLGELGLTSFLWLMNDPRFDGLPASIETEKGDDEAADRGNIAVLRALVGRAKVPTGERVAAIRRAAERGEHA